MSHVFAVDCGDGLLISWQQRYDGWLGEQAVIQN